jgi:hypothetical protein
MKLGKAYEWGTGLKKVHFSVLKVSFAIIIYAPLLFSL